MTPDMLEIELRELSYRIKNIMTLVSKGQVVDPKLILQLIEVCIKCDDYFEEHQTIEPADIELMNNLISVIELTATQYMLSSSPNRNTFQRDKYIERQTEKGQMNDPETDKMLELYQKFDQLKKEKEQDPAWQNNNLEYDLRSTDWILEKTRTSETYAQNLYAALCNNEFVKNDVWPLLKEERWSCSWRYAGGIIADMREEGDYIDWYCSGMGGPTGDMGFDGYLPESVVSDEVREDLLKLGWLVIPDGE